MNAREGDVVSWTPSWEEYGDKEGLKHTYSSVRHQIVLVTSMIQYNHT